MAIYRGVRACLQGMPTGQAHTLQSLHYHLLEKAFERFTSSTDMALYLRYSLKAQSQCRQSAPLQLVASLITSSNWLGGLTVPSLEGTQ